jgi:predicted DNA-binding WGR domain protein
MILEKRNFVCADIEKNCYRFWNISISDTNQIITEYGRVGNSKATDVKNFSSACEARKYFDSKVRDKQKIKKRRDSYTEITILDGESSTKNNPTAGLSKHLSDIAVSQIQTSSKEVQDLIRWFSDQNIHNICGSTTIKYSVAEGCFKTPLGIISQGDIDEAKKLLENISILVEANDFSSDLTRLANTYLRKIPQDIGGSSTKINLKNILGDKIKIKSQWDIIEGLEAAVSKSTEQDAKLFNAKIELAKVSDPKLIELGSKLKNVYALAIYPVRTI